MLGAGGALWGFGGGLERKAWLLALEGLAELVRRAKDRPPEWR